MAVVKNLIVRAGADFSSLKSAMRATSANAKEFKSNVSRSMKDAQRSTRELAESTKSVNTLGSSLKKLRTTLVATFVGLGIVKYAKDSVAAINATIEYETKLSTVLRQRMGATDEVIKSVFALTDAQEKLGVVSHDAQKAGVAELATYLDQASTIKTLLPMLNNLVAAQYGYKASAEQVVGMATMVGKVMDGQLGALSRYGYSWTKAQEKILKYGTEAQRAALLVDIVTQSTGQMNEELGKTPQGKMLVFKNTLASIQETIGRGLLSVIQAVMPYLQAMANAFLRVAQAAAMFASALFGKVVTSKATAQQTDDVDALGDAYTDAGKKAKSASSSLAGFDEINSLSSSSGSEDTSVGGGGSAVSLDFDTSAATESADEMSTKIQGIVDKIKELGSSISLQPLIDSFNNLKTSIQPFTEAMFVGLKWLWNNILVPFAAWTIQRFIPAFLDLLAGAISFLTPIIKALMPMGTWFWDNFLQPIASWTGGVIISVLKDLANALKSVGDWMSNNQSTVINITKAVGLFFAAWKTIELLAFIQMAGGVSQAIKLMSSAIYANTAAKAINAGETAYLTLLYAKDFIMSIVNTTAAFGKQLIAWGLVTAATIEHKVQMLILDGVIVGQFIKNMALSTAELVTNAGKWIAATAAMVANKVVMVASTVVQAAMTVAMVAWNVAAGIGTAVTTAFGVAVAILSSPITLIIAAITLLVAGIILLVKNWDTVKEVAANVWEGIKKTWTIVADWFKTNVTNPIGNMFIDMFNFIIKGINTLVSGLNKIKFDVPDWVPGIGGQSFGVNIATLNTIPRLARGGIVDTATNMGNYIAGEAGTEMIVPLENTSFTDKVASALGTAVMTAMQMGQSNNSGGGEIIMQVDGVTFARVMNAYSAKEGTRIGGSMIRTT